MEKTLEDDMVYFPSLTAEERFSRLEHKAAEIRKMLLGALLMAEDSWKDELSVREEGIEIIKGIKRAEESFTQGSQPDRFKRLERTLDVIHQRARTMFELVSYISEYKKHD